MALEIFGADIVTPPPAPTPSITANELIRLFDLAQANTSAIQGRKKRKGKESDSAPEARYGDPGGFMSSPLPGRARTNRHAR